MKKSKIIILTITIVVWAALCNAQISKSNGPGSCKILKKGKGPIEIPFTMHNRKPLFELKINGKNATLMIDNGVLWDPVWLFGTPLVKELQLKPIKDAEIEGAGKGDPTAAYESNNVTLQFKDIIFYEQPVVVSPPTAGFARIFPGVDGQLCNTFFKHFIVEFDFINQKVILYNPKDFKFKGNGSVLDMTLTETGTYAVPFSFVKSLMLNGEYKLAIKYYKKSLELNPKNENAEMMIEKLQKELF